MIYTNFIVKDANYKLRLTASGICNIENRIGKNVLSELLSSNVPKLSFLLQVICEAMQPYQHGISFDDVCAIFDDYADEGKTVSDLSDVVLEVFRNCGLIKKVSDEDGSQEEPEEGPKA